MQGLLGSHLFLVSFSWSEVALILILVSFGVLFAGRQFFEGAAYNSSHCALFGGSAVILFILLGRYVLLTTPVLSIFVNIGFHITAGVIACMIAVTNVRTLLKKEPGKKETIVDTYHNWVLLPGYIYFALTLAPVIMFSGNAYEIVGMMILIVFYGLTAFVDIQTGRLDQPKFFQKHGLQLPIRDAW